MYYLPNNITQARILTRLTAHTQVTVGYNRSRVFLGILDGIPHNLFSLSFTPSISPPYSTLFLFHPPPPPPPVIYLLPFPHLRTFPAFFLFSFTIFFLLFVFPSSPTSYFSFSPSSPPSPFPLRQQSSPLLCFFSASSFRPASSPPPSPSKFLLPSPHSLSPSSLLSRHCPPIPASFLPYAAIVTFSTVSFLPSSSFFLSPSNYRTLNMIARDDASFADH